MSSLINERYDKVVCINLKERPNKYAFMKERFDRHGIEVQWYHPVILNYSKHFVDAYADKYNDYEKHIVLFNKHFPNEFGTMTTHYYVIKTALLEGVNNLFVFEDDCCFHKDWNELLPKYLNTIPEDADGILLYSFMKQLEPQNVRVKPRWTKGFASWSFVGYGMNRRAMQGYVDLIDRMPMIADRGSWEMMTHGGYNFYICTPPLVIPSKEFTSDIRGENKNYETNQSIFLMGINREDYI
jgi:GR25 family glycosyltransferase involved in LPS biosynthesis